jgi:hypothetical protein
MTGLFAQNHTEIELVRSAYKLEKKGVVADYLKLSNDDAAKFWPIYEKYEIERSALGDRRIKLITDLVNEKHNMGDVKKADEMVKESAELTRKEASLREKYYDTVKTGVSPQVAIDFYQIEEAVYITVRMKLMEMLAH